MGEAILERRRRVTSFFYRMAGAKPSSTSTCTSPPSSPWHSCKYLRIHSFRKDYHHKGDRDFNPLLSDSSEVSATDDVEVVICGLKSDDQFFFEPAGGSRFVVDRERDHVVASSTTVPFDGSIAMAVDSILGFQGVSMANDGAWDEGLGVDGGDAVVILEDEQEEDLRDHKFGHGIQFSEFVMDCKSQQGDSPERWIFFSLNATAQVLTPADVAANADAREVMQAVLMRRLFWRVR
ncbi:transcription repressor OFP15-like [Canna indica]|uniref:Transcription repressor OFP15-like n=1 Tax=Canna indica TaxID=4628 RepID=A0AAQ3KYM4_9LILI|nr:transcription repressor OFP15-like [Canna indica]